MKKYLWLLLLVLVGCSGEPRPQFIYDVTEEGSAYVAAYYFQEGTDWEGYYWSEDWYEEASKEWAYSAANGKLTWDGAPKGVVTQHGNVFSIDTSKLKPNLTHPKEFFKKYVIKSNRTFKLVLIDSEYTINESQYNTILKRKKTGLGIWVDNRGYVPEHKVKKK